MRVLGSYKGIINPDIDESVEAEQLVILREKSGEVYSVQEVNKHYCESHDLYYYLFHCFYGRNALNFNSWDFQRIKEQIDIDESDVIIDDFRPRKPRVSKTEMFIVNNDFLRS